jgi:hypothetical protein
MHLARDANDAVELGSEQFAITVERIACSARNAAAAASTRGIRLAAIQRSSQGSACGR